MSKVCVLQRQLNAINFSVSSDLNYVLLISDVTKVFRYSTEARYNIYEVATENHYPLTPLDDSEEDAPLLQLVQWSPRGNALAFIYRNDIYYRAEASSNAKVVRLTTSGEPGVVFNGVPDWLYEEEILHGPRALWFSPDGSSLAYASFNDSQVGELQYSWYGSLDARLAYPETRSLRYPKVKLTKSKQMIAK
ncbi:hypothetical protein B566_EDAN006347 [Ephemera danica]|nr:hypothetical protein B566_EDAN006347 [Ephemera danica]